MRFSRPATLTLVGISFLFFTQSVEAQSAIAGTVRDTSGAVLPGVTVEASSPALIEKFRTTITSDTGQYRVVDLRPGTYTVTFTLAGFNTIARSGIVLEANFTAPINVELQVGSLQETVTVTGESPVVDVQNSQRREVVSQQFLDRLPTGRSYSLVANTIPSITNAGQFDVGGSSTMWSAGTLNVHGSDSRDSRVMIDGMVADGMMGTGQCQCFYDNEMQTQEIAVQVGGGSAEYQLGGVQVNRIPRSGSNELSGDQLLLFSNGGLEARNVDDALRARGITTPSRLYRQYDINYSLGGPLLRDRLWFFFSGRNWAYDQYVANTFNPDGTQYADTSILMAYPVRLTMQATKKDRVTTLFNWGNRIKENFAPPGPGTTQDAISRQYTPAEYLAQAKWTSTLSDNLLFETGYTRVQHRVVYAYKSAPSVLPATCFTAFALCPPGTSYGSLAHRDTLLGRDTIAPFPGTGAGQGPEYRPSTSNVVQASFTYVSGAHAFKAGVQHRSGPLRQVRVINGDIGQQYRDGVPFAATILNTPIDTTVNLNHDMGVYVQDTWTMRRLTLSPGVRWDYFNSSIPAQSSPAGRFVPERHFDAIEDVPNWHNVVPRFGASYDVFGTGRTAVKGNIGLYVQGEAVSFAQTYNPSFVATDQRTWNDLNRDDVAQENELGPPSNLAFGVRRDRNPDPDIKRPYQMLWDAAVQHEVLPGFGMSVSFVQRSFYEQLWTDNLALEPGDYQLVTVADPRGTGAPLPVYNIAGSKFGLVDELDANSDQNTRMYRGVDVSFNLRLRGGAAFYGGTSTGRTISRQCQVEDLNSLRFCDQSEYDIPFQTSFKVAGTYPLAWGVLLSGTFSSVPGSERSVTYQVTRTLIPTLSQASVNVRLNEPGTEFNDRVNQLNLTVAKSFRRGKLDIRPEAAAFNAFNANPVLSQVNTFGPSLGRVNTILNPRLIRLGVAVKF
jgi:hypothetical protein